MNIEPDYEKYTLEELNDSYQHINREKFPERFKTLEDEIEKRKIKPISIFENKLETFVIKEPKLEYVGFWKRVLIALLSWVIMIPLIPLVLFFAELSLKLNNFLPALLFDLFTLYVLNIWMVQKYGGTIPKLIMKVRIIDINGDYLNFANAFARIFPSLLILCVRYLRIKYVSVNYPTELSNVSFWEFESFMRTHSDMLNIPYYIGVLFIYADVFTVQLNEKKRAIHDYIAGSYVVTKESLESFRNQR